MVGLGSVLVGGSLYLAGVALLVATGWEFRRRRRLVADAERVPVEITSVERDADAPSVSFRYTYDGEQYTSGKITPRELDQGVSDEDPTAGYHEGQTVQGYVAPDRPSEAFLERGSSTAIYVVLVVMSGALVGVGVFVLLAF